jgi:hypothetical protein
MQTWKSVIGVIGALVPIVYCGGLIYHFLDASGSVQEAQEIGLGPTLLGLSLVGLLFCIPLIVKLVRIFVGPGSPGSGRRGGANPSNDGDGDADAVLARYMARRAADGATSTPAEPPAPQGGGPATRPTFGRETR